MKGRGRKSERGERGGERKSERENGKCDTKIKIIGGKQECQQQRGALIQ